MGSIQKQYDGCIKMMAEALDRLFTLEAKYVDATEGCCPYCDHLVSIEKESQLYICTECGWKEQPEDYEV